MGSSPLDPVIQQLDGLGKDATKIVKQSLNAPMKFVQQQARWALGSSGIKDFNRSVWRSIGRKVFTKQGYIVGAKVGIGVGMKNPRQRNYKGETDDQFAARRAKTRNIVSPIAHLLSMGTAERSTGYTTRIKRGKNGLKVNHDRTGFKYRHTGRINPNHYFKTAVDGATAQAAGMFQDRMRELVAKALGR